MMDFNIENDELLKSYLVNSNKVMQMQSLDHLKLLASFYNIDQQNKGSKENIRITHNVDKKPSGIDFVSVENISKKMSSLSNIERPKSTK